MSSNYLSSLIALCLSLSVALTIVSLWSADNRQADVVKTWLQYSPQMALDELAKSSPNFVISVSLDSTTSIVAGRSALITQKDIHSWHGRELTVVTDSPLLSLTNPGFWLTQILFFMLMATILWRHDRISSLRMAGYKELSRQLSQALFPNRLTAVPLRRLQSQLKVHVQKFDELQVQQHRNTDFIRRKTFVDHETAIGNRLFFDNRLEAMLLETQTKLYGAVFLIQCTDLDLIEAQHGQEQAKSVMMSLASLLNINIEQYEQSVIARHSEHDIAILLPFIGAEEIEAVATKFLSQCSKTKLPEGTNADSLFHIGIALFEAGESNYQVMAEADMALRAAQLLGPTGWYQYDKQLLTPQIKKGSVRWRTTLEIAISKNRFTMLYQPIMQQGQQDVHHYEILARLREDNGDLVCASVFLPMASKCGMLRQIDELMVRNTIKLLECEAEHDTVCSINISVESLLDKRFVDWLNVYFAQHKQVVHRIIVEMAEYPLQRTGNKLHDSLNMMHGLGIRILIDQVGFRLVEQSYLNQLPISFIKLDNSITRNIDTKLENQLFVRSIQGVCDGRNIPIFASGVESSAEWKIIQRLGLHGAQGHYFTEPLAGLYNMGQILT